MKTCICAIAKMENDYINDWCKWHLSLGFSDIFIYDNNDADYEPVESRIDKDTLKSVHIIKVPGVRENFQKATYTEFYRQFNRNFNWIAFIDIDEFIVLKEWKNICDFLKDKRFKRANVIQLDWHMYGDNDEIKQDINVPIYERITKEITDENKWRMDHQGKSFVRGGLQNVSFISAHCPSFNKKPTERCLANGEIIATNPLNIVGKRLEEAYIAHYMTKTLDEFLNQKFNRIENIGCKKTLLTENESRRFKYYFNINKKTPEKIKYIEEKLGRKVNI